MNILNLIPATIYKKCNDIYYSTLSLSLVKGSNSDTCLTIMKYNVYIPWIDVPSQDKIIIFQTQPTGNNVCPKFFCAIMIIPWGADIIPHASKL